MMGNSDSSLLRRLLRRHSASAAAAMPPHADEASTSGGRLVAFDDFHVLRSIGRGSFGKARSINQSIDR